LLFKNIINPNIYKYSGNCPPAACDDGCSNFVVFTDNCPICQCDNGTWLIFKIWFYQLIYIKLNISGSGSREPCDSSKDCSQGGDCRNHICRYKNVPKNLPKGCDFDYQCVADAQCLKGKCVSGTSYNK